MTEEMKSELTEVTTLQVGDVLKGKVVQVENNQALVDVGYKFEAVLPISELSSLHVDQVSDVLSVGDEVEVKVLRIREDEDKLIVSKKAVDAEAAWSELQRKYETGETLTATVADIVKGGLVVDVGVRGFIPASHVERHFVEDFTDYKGRELTLKVIEIDPEKNKLILSHKAVLEDELNRKKEETLASLEEGQVLEGTVQRLTDFGAFVDIGGVDGLVHVSELAWHRVEHPADVLKEGDRVKVKVLKVNREQERISLSIKETQEGPWEQVQKHIQIGDVVTGKVKRLASFGAFVEVYPGVEGLVHVSQISRRHVATPAEVLEEGQEVQVKVLDMQPEQKRISLSMKEVEPEELREEAEQFENLQSSGLNVTLGDVYPELRKLK
ncbi:MULTISPECIES: 30S ribosomal protein S1 [Thermoactinomyces]|jgi:small subunit ribosomal protein S1|uniref:30S ribosomal protein S1 n=1 Tax=Thermoactinomyces daqus TaxID=1329516 RepID=A0A7W1XAI9_9BACL|nr:MULTISPECIES: 30S ribosomal protein S1 [Thermoactinomyces]MBA4543122.1 30S ribosomal protein S1 [Thermoactinomyces daqus]MBH8596643.1 30S ribosomal protein S1 [Thermoactinomyces sp. CICC 10523]MBH8603405.1 30S ribosomal protein S1 [Thermoactinomyces sp. CICC 10522]MBH8607828.1 30S ribosomal protein S1 [Thermoactinomyces sp. CICC 10521]